MPPAYAGAPSDPTAVMGRRTGAWIVDFILWLLLGAFLGPTPLSPLAEYVDTNDFPGIDCADIERVNDFSSCVEVGDRLYFVEGGEAGIAFAVAWIIAPLAYAAFQGATGRSPGKALFGVKVVDEFGSPPGFGKSLVRTLLWVVDGIPCIIPLVGFITGLTSNGHRRVGDMAAKTFVVGKDHSGPVIVAGLPTAATQGYLGAAYGPPGQWGAPPAGPPGAPGQPQPWGAPAPGAPGGPPSGGWEAQPSGGFPVPGAAPSGGLAGPGSSDRPAPPSGWAPPGAAPAPGAPGAPGEPSRTGPAGGPGATGDDDGRGSGETTGPARDATADTTTGPGATAAGAAWTAGTTASSTTPPADTASADAGTDADAATRPGERPPTGAAGPTTGTSTEATEGPETGRTSDSGAGAERPFGDTTGADAGAPGADVPTETAPQAAPSSYNPQWDAARGTYIVWEPNRGKWLGWDESAQEWKPL
jgi:uncharacterized RDD family membrane protein YckC